MVLLSHLTEDMTCESDVVMFATGREAYVEGLALDQAGVALNDKGAVIVDDYSRDQRGQYLGGGRRDRPHQPDALWRSARAPPSPPQNSWIRPPPSITILVPTAVFSQPPVGCVGMTEAQARHAVGKVDVYMSRFRPMKEAFMGAQERMLMKLIVEESSQKILGCHIVGPDGPEIIQLAAVALKMGATKQQWDNTCALASHSGRGVGDHAREAPAHGARPVVTPDRRSGANAISGLAVRVRCSRIAAVLGYIGPLGLAPLAAVGGILALPHG